MKTRVDRDVIKGRIKRALIKELTRKNGLKAITPEIYRDVVNAYDDYNKVWRQLEAIQDIAVEVRDTFQKYKGTEYENLFKLSQSIVEKLGNVSSGVTVSIDDGSIYKVITELATLSKAYEE